VKDAWKEGEAADRRLAYSAQTVVSRRMTGPHFFV
jgi:hypothetical protein